MKFLIRYFSTTAISLGFLSALGASAFIYLYHFHIHWPWLQAFLGLCALAAWLVLPPRAMFWSGFFTGVLWFWWIGMSFRYYDLTWMIPGVVIAVGAVYGLIFRLVGALPHPAPRALAVGLLEFVHPFGFDWFRPALMFTGSVLGERLWQLWLILAVLTIVLSFKHKARYLALFALIFAAHHPLPTQTSTLNTQYSTLKSKIQLVQTFIPQEKKWQPRYRNAIVDLNLHTIDEAIRQGKKAVILPESAFPLYLNRDIPLMQKLLEKSEAITIVTGALFYDRKPYNSTYLFKKGKVRVMHKVVLVPFGEGNPLPEWMGRWVNRIFFDGAEDYTTAQAPSDFTMLGRTWRNAICYEATCERLYAGDPRLMVAISNNAWFAPSTEATLQRLLMQLQANRHGTTIFHATNGPGSGVVTPR